MTDDVVTRMRGVYESHLGGNWTVALHGHDGYDFTLMCRNGSFQHISTDLSPAKSIAELNALASRDCATILANYQSEREKSI